MINHLANFAHLCADATLHGDCMKMYKDRLDDHFVKYQPHEEKMAVSYMLVNYIHSDSGTAMKYLSSTMIYCIIEY